MNFNIHKFWLCIFSFIYEFPTFMHSYLPTYHLDNNSYFSLKQSSIVSYHFLAR